MYGYFAGLLLPESRLGPACRCGGGWREDPTALEGLPLISLTSLLLEAGMPVLGRPLKT